MVKVDGRDRGAVAVEFAILVPFLLLLVIGIVELSHEYNVKITLTQAAREAARTMAVTNSPSAAQAQAVKAAVGLSPALTASNVSVSATGTGGSCSSGAEANATVTYTYSTFTGFFGAQMTSTAGGAMQCGG